MGDLTEPQRAAVRASADRSVERRGLHEGHGDCRSRRAAAAVDGPRDVRQRRVLRFVRRRAVDDRAVAAPVRRPSSGAQHHARRRPGHARTEPYRGAARDLRARGPDGAAARSRGGVERALLRVARRAATRAGHSRLSSARSRARPGPRRPDDPARRHQRLDADGARNASCCSSWPASGPALSHAAWRTRKASRARSERRRHVVRLERSDRGRASRPTFASKGRRCTSSMRRKAETIRRRTSTRSTAIRPTSTALAGGRGSAARRPAARARGRTVGGARSSARRVPAGDGRQHRA